VRDEILDMEQYLNSDTFRRQANTVLRLTVITIVGLVGTTVTGFLGMNLIAAAEVDLATKVLYFVLVTIPVTLLVFYSVVKSKRLADFLETLSDERASSRAKLGALLNVWGKR
jgi:Mg2+ and Co2+ transporter CorA